MSRLEDLANGMSEALDAISQDNTKGKCLSLSGITKTEVNDIYRQATLELSKTADKSDPQYGLIAEYVQTIEPKKLDLDKLEGKLEVITDCINSNNR